MTKAMAPSQHKAKVPSNNQASIMRLLLPLVKTDLLIVLSAFLFLYGRRNEFSGIDVRVGYFVAFR